MNPGNLHLIALALAASLTTAIAATNPAPANFGASQVLAWQNIFDANRPATGRTNTQPVQPKVDSFTLTGTLTSGEGRYAFFEGNVIQRRQAALKPADRVEGFAITGITKDGVSLESAGQPAILLSVGMQLTRKDNGPWKLISAPISARQP